MNRVPPQRKPIVRKHRWYPTVKPREDPVTPEMYAAVLKRDGGCVAPQLDPNAGPCWGRNRIEHVKVEPRMGKRGELLAILCQGHTEDGARGGYVWATDRDNRQRVRDYVQSFDT